jgi:hypothetical protein
VSTTGLLQEPAFQRRPIGVLGVIAETCTNTVNPLELAIDHFDEALLTGAFGKHLARETRARECVAFRPDIRPVPITEIVDLVAYPEEFICVACPGTDAPSWPRQGTTLKATTVLAMLHWLGLKPSHSRTRVSDDNAFVESLFRSAKYRAGYPTDGFGGMREAGEWAHRFMHWYNHEDRHSGIGYASPTKAPGPVTLSPAVAGMTGMKGRRRALFTAKRAAPPSRPHQQCFQRRAMLRLEMLQDGHAPQTHRLVQGLAHLVQPAQTP